jgi:pimeloyl-ACP methyl ester carboxylesterase
MSFDTRLGGMKRLMILAFVLTTCLFGAPNAHAAAPIKNIVLVHGAFADGSSFAKVIPLLQAEGFNVVAVQIPLSSLAADVAATKRVIAQQNGPVILVGHSWAGMVVSEAGNDSKVAGLVYIGAIVPNNGESVSKALKPYPPPPGFSQIKADSAGYLTLTRAGIDEDFVPDVPASERAIVYATQEPWNSKELTEKVTDPAWSRKPSWFIINADDRMVPPQYQRAMARRIHATATTLGTGHVPMLSMPSRVTDVIIDAARSAAANVSYRSL